MPLLDDSCGNKKIHERRAEVRAITLGSPLYLYPEEGGGLETLDAITVNVSSIGICVYTDRELEVGARFKVQSKAVGENPRAGKVIWCKRVDEKIFKAGLALY